MSYLHRASRLTHGLQPLGQCGFKASAVSGPQPAACFYHHRMIHTLSATCSGYRWHRTKEPWNNTTSSLPHLPVTQLHTNTRYQNDHLHRLRYPPLLLHSTPQLSDLPRGHSFTPRDNFLVPMKVTENSQRALQQSSETKAQANKAFALSARAIVEASPVSVQPYLRLMRIDRPIGTWLLFLPCAWSISLSAPPGCLPDPLMLTLFAMGSFFMRGAGCTINDMWDKDFDAKVERTKDRPLASGQVSSFKALVFLGGQLSISLAILLSLNFNTIVLGACSLIPCIIYPLMKRVTYWPQIFLGITLNWGVLISWSAIHGCVQLPGLLLYGACLLHTTFYDTVYSHQDKEDDVLVGVKSTALRLGDQTKPWLAGFTALMVTGLGTTGVLCDQTWPYYAGVAYTASHLAHQIYTVDLNNPDDCGKKFRSNRNLGLVFWAAIVAGNLLRKDKEEERKKDGGEGIPAVENS